jgi:hypothetical protein
MNNELASDIVMACALATALPEAFSDLVGALEEEENMDSLPKTVDGLRLVRNLIKLCGLDNPDCVPAEITSLAELKAAKAAINALVYKEYIPKIMSDPPQLEQLNAMPYLDGAIAYGDAYLARTTLSEFQKQSAKMTLTPAVRVEALRQLHLATLASAKTKLDFAAIQHTVEKVVTITGTETFEPPTDFMDHYNSQEEVEIKVRDGLEKLAKDLMLNFSSEASRPNPLRTSTSYLLSYCKVGQKMSAASDLGIN